MRVRASEGVVAVLTGADIPGENDISPSGRNDEPVLAEGKVRVSRPADLRGHRRNDASWRAARAKRAVKDRL